MKKLFKASLYFIFLLSCLLTTSCNQDSIVSSDLEPSSNIFSESDLSEYEKKQEITQFAKILSKSISQSEDLRIFLKKEALRMFDKNYDILYYPLKDKKVSGNLSFRDILITNSSETEISKIENNLPLLNILIPRIAFLNVLPENLDTKDSEIPVAIENNSKGTDLYIKGQKVDTFADNEFPGFNVIVVNLNNRVIASKNISTRSSEGNSWSYAFKSENYKGSLRTRSFSGSFNHSEMPFYLYKKAESAFEAGFNKDDHSKNQTAFQRDYIYYGMTPTQTTGELNRAVTEYLSYMIVDPKVYFKISDEQSNHINDDPYIKETDIENKKHPLSREEVLKRMWTQGAYNFIFEVSSSKSKESAKMPVPIFPEEIWNFYIRRGFKKGGLFHRDKYLYTIDPTKFIAKTYYFDPATVTFGKWNISEESLIRYISIYEEDSGDDITETSTESFTHVHSSNFKGDVKIGLGLGKIGDKTTTGDAGFSAETSSSNTTTTTNTITIKRHQGDDLLGYKVPIYFYDPIVVSANDNTGGFGGAHFGGSTGGFTGAHSGGSTGGSTGGHFGGGRRNAPRPNTFGYGRTTNPTNSKYVVHEYNTGSIRFGIDVR